ncbi:MAG: Asp-tRNA(Asn)/Glu-tRNA(Gln) amidotransferase subunit GatC [Patescibacteria group bacterium]
MSLTRNEVKILADLARLELSEEELARAEKDLDSILGYVDRLQKIDTQGVEASSMPAKMTGWREDVAFKCDDLTVETILSNFPSRKQNMLATPGVFERPKGKQSSSSS